MPCLCTQPHASKPSPIAPSCPHHDWQAFYEAGGKLPAGVWEDVLAAVKEVEEVRELCLLSTGMCFVLGLTHSGRTCWRP